MTKMMIAYLLCTGLPGVALLIWRIRRSSRLDAITRQERLVIAYERSNENHPGLYEEAVARERAVLRRMVAGLPESAAETY